MNLKRYKKIVKENSKKENLFKNIFVAFVSGGLVGLFGEVFVKFMENKYYMNTSVAYMYLMILLVVVASVLTGLGFFDKIVSFCRCGLIVPTTGFAHAMTSSALDHESEGPIKGIGSNIFMMTGSVILYGLVSSMFLAFIKGVITK